MNAQSNIKPDTASNERMTRLRAEADAEDDALWERMASGEHDAERLRRSKASLAFINSLPPLDKPDAGKADDAVAGLATDLLAQLGIQPPRILTDRGVG